MVADVPLGIGFDRDKTSALDIERHMNLFDAVRDSLVGKAWFPLALIVGSFDGWASFLQASR